MYEIPGQNYLEKMRLLYTTLHDDAIAPSYLIKCLSGNGKHVGLNQMLMTINPFLGGARQEILQKFTPDERYANTPNGDNSKRLCCH